jgi:hypothetical protein
VDSMGGLTAAKEDLLRRATQHREENGDWKRPQSEFASLLIRLPDECLRVGE